MKKLWNNYGQLLSDINLIGLILFGIFPVMVVGITIYAVAARLLKL